VELNVEAKVGKVDVGDRVTLTKLLRRGNLIDTISSGVSKIFQLQPSPDWVNTIV
jgi:hypothetical protein